MLYPLSYEGGGPRKDSATIATIVAGRTVVACSYGAGATSAGESPFQNRGP